jgi:diguanylate cyclase (GGDEF)-like protein
MNKLNLSKYGVMSNYYEPFITCEIRLDHTTNTNELYIINANEPFLKFANISATNVENRKFRDVCIGSNTTIFNWPIIIMNAAMTNDYKIIEQYIEALEKYAKLFIFGYENGFFNIIFQDVTEKKLINRTLQDKNRQIDYLLNDLRVKNDMDNVTKLYNFQFVMDSLDTSIKNYYDEHIKFSILHIDIINFKELNLKLGSKAADKLLLEIGDCIITNTRKIDFACRYLGDKFIIVHNDVDIDIAKILFDRLKNSLKRDIILYDGSAMHFNGAGIDYSGQKKEELLIELENKMKKSKLLGIDMILQ